MHIKLDEQLSQQLKSIVAQEDYEVSTVLDQDRSGMMDELLWEHIQDRDEFLITADKEFANIRKYPPGSHHGVLLLRPAYESLPAYKRLMNSFFEQYSLEELVEKTSVMDESGLRIRTDNL